MSRFPKDVEVWTGQHWKHGRWLRTIERGRYDGWYEVEVQRLVEVDEEWVFVWRKRKVQPDHVRLE